MKTFEKRMSLTGRMNFAWCFSGKTVLAASRAVLVMLIAKLGTAEMVGRYTFAFAVTTPIFLAAEMDLNSVLVTDAHHRYEFDFYFGLRITTSLIALMVTTVIAIAERDVDTGLVLLFIGFSKCCESVGDILFGLMQREDRLDIFGKSLILKGVLSVLVMGLILYYRKSLTEAAAGLAIVYLAVLIFYNFRSARSFVKIGIKFDRKAFSALLKMCIPLGFVLLFSSLGKNMSNYMIGVFIGSSQLGYFSPALYFMTFGSLVIGALCQSKIVRLSRLCKDGDSRGFLKMVGGMQFAAFGLGIFMFLICVFFGAQIIAALYRPDYAAFSDMLAIVMIAAAFSYPAEVLNCAAVAAREFRVLPFVYGGTLIFGLCLNLILIPFMGLKGAAWCILINSLVQYAVNLALVNRRIIKKIGKDRTKTEPMTVPDLSVEHIDVENGFNGDFIEEWKRLLEEGESKNPFSDPDWLLAWWNIYGKDYEPFILAVRTGYKLAGVLPLIKKGRKSYGNITFMGYPQATHSDIAARPENIPAVVFAALDFMCELKGNLYISLPGLRQGSAFCDAVEKYVEQKNMIFCEASVPSPVIRVNSSDFQAFCRNRFSSRAMKNNRRSESRLALLGEVTIRSLDQSEMDAAFGLHDKRWRKKLDTSGFTSDKSKQLFTRLLSLSNSRWHAKALGLFVSGRLIAFQYGFIYGSKYALLYKSAHDDAFKAFAPGKMIKREFIRQSIEASLNVVDLGIGYEDYKAEYTDDQVIIKHIILSKDSFVRRILSRIPFSTVTWKGKLKRNRHIVLFKRNTLGEIRYALSLIWFRDSLDRIARTAKVRGFGTYLLNKCFPLKKKSLYIKKTGRNEPVSDVHVRMAGSADIEFLSILMGCAEERIVKKFYESAKCYIAEKDGAILCALWSLTINNKTVISDFCQNRHTCSKTDIICLLKFVLNKHQGCSSATVSYNRSDKILSEAIVQAGLGETEDLPENDRAKATGATAV